MLGSGSNKRVDREPVVKAYDPAKLRVVRDGVRPRPLLPLLSTSARRLAADPLGYMLRPDDELERPEFAWSRYGRPYSDPALARGSPELRRLALCL